MKVRMLVGITGTRNGEPWPRVGEVIEVGDQEGADLCADRMAEPVVEDPEPVKAEPRKATARKAEKRA